MASIKFDNVSFAYGNNQILRNFSLEVDDSQIMCLVGPSGCGKTTLIRCLLGFNKPSSGEIWIGDRCVFSQAKRINIPPERRGVGVVFQDYAVWPHMTVLENVCYPMKKQRMSKAEIRQKAENALKQVRMTEYASYLPSQLSGGQQQRAAILDEPHRVGARVEIAQHERGARARGKLGRLVERHEQRVGARAFVARRPSA